MTDRPLRIAFISPFLFRTLRGIERFTVHLANELANLGQDVTLLTRAGQIDPVSPISRKVSVKNVPQVRYFESKWAIPFYANRLLRERFDVVNVFFAGYGEAEALRFGRRYRDFSINFIVDYPPDLVPHRYREFTDTGLAQEIDRVIAKTQRMASQVGELIRRPVSVIPSAVDLEYFDPEQICLNGVRERLGLSSDEFFLFTAAALEERKGLQHVIEALALLRSAGKRVSYVIAGEGPARGMIEQRVRELGLQGCVHLLGAQRDLRPLYKAADIFLLPSFGEAFPNALLEAMAMGLPTIVSRHPPYDEIVTPRFGIQVDEREPGVLANSIAALLENPTRRHELGAAARRQCQQHYGWKRIAKQYLELFRQELSS